MKRSIIILVIVITMLTMAGCAAGPNELMNFPNEEGKVAGFWRGLWHGIISLPAFIISLFSETVQMYEVHNNGAWYDFGFLLGILIVYGGGGGKAASRCSRRD